MPPIEIDKILSDPLLIVASVLIVASPITFIFALVKFRGASRRAPFAIPHHEMESPVPAPSALEHPESDQSLAPLEQLPPQTPPEPPAPPIPVEAPPAPAPASPEEPRRPRRADSAAEKTVVMPPGMAEMQSEMEIALSQLRVMNKRIAALEAEVSRLRSAKPDQPGGAVPPQPL